MMLTDNSHKPEALVVGAPRTGFSLLISILSHIQNYHLQDTGLRQKLLRLYIDHYGQEISNSITRTAENLGLAGRLVLNPEFKRTTGGPKWLDSNDFACVRKYIGLTGLGDFTLILRFPVQVLEYDPIIHSHVSPSTWINHPIYGNRVTFCPIRDPLATVTSATLSLNALTSEYIQQRYSNADQTRIREELALFKLSNPVFFQGLFNPLADFLQDLIEVDHSKIHRIRFEHLIEHPEETIKTLSEQMQLPVSLVAAGSIWQYLKNRNLTGAHKHNYRPGGGNIKLWQDYLTQNHIDMFASSRLGKLREELGYGELPALNNKTYNSFQRQLDKLLDTNEVYHEGDDPDLFEFAFNKSNLDSTAFERFHTYEWRNHSRIERSSVNNEEPVMKIWDAAESATARFNQNFLSFLNLPFEDYSILEQYARSLPDKTLGTSMLAAIKQHRFPRSIAISVSRKLRLIKRSLSGAGIST